MARWLTTIAAAALLLGCTTTAYAATGSPPVTNPDQVRVHAGDFTIVDATANDKDPDGDQLEVCRVGQVPRGIEAIVSDGEVALGASRRAHGTYTLTYYACDDGYLSAGTLTVVVGPPRQYFDIQPVARAAQAGRGVVIKLVNTYKHKTFHCVWGPQNSDRVAGRATVKPHTTVRITVHLSAFDIECTGPHQGVGASFGGEDEEFRTAG
jgi:hypothetical protein